MRAKIFFITLAVDNLGRSVAFYQDGLGWPTEGIVGQEFHDEVTRADGSAITVGEEAECSAGVDDRCAGDGRRAQEFPHEPAVMAGHSPRPRPGKVSRSQSDDGSSSSAQRRSAGRIALRSVRP